MKECMTCDYKIPDGMDRELIKSFHKEIFYDQEYNRFGISVEKDDIVLDAGANVGIFTDYALVMGAKKIIAIESDFNIYSAFRKNIFSDKVICRLGFVSDNESVNNDIQSYNLKQIFLKFNLTYLDFAKIDIEGHEYDLLLNCDEDFLCRINKLAIEVHFNYHEDYVKTLAIIQKLNKNNFNVFYDRPHPNYNLGMLYAKNNSFYKTNSIR